MLASGPSRSLPPGPTRADRIEVRTVAVGTGPSPGCDQLFLAYGRFRAWMYTEVNAILPPERIRADGTDFDHYDPHAVHLAAVSTMATVPSMRIRSTVTASSSWPKAGCPDGRERAWKRGRIQ